MSDPIPDGPPAAPASLPGERRLAHPPSDRYRTAEPSLPQPDPAASPARGMAYGLIAVVAGSIGLVVLGGVLAASAGLLVVAGATGWAVGAGIGAGAGPRIAGDRRVRRALALVLISVAAGQLGLWLYGRFEGGVLGPLDYLWETFGPLVPLQFVVASIAAWATVR